MIVTLAQAQIDDTSGPKYGWLLESKYITPKIVDHVKMFPEKYLETFDAIFTHNQELLALDPKFKWCPAQGFWIKEPKIYEKTKMISMISSNKTMCDGHRLRLEWVDRLWGQVDMYGRGFKEIENKEEGLCDYMFSVAIENGQYETYFTEKLLTVLQQVQFLFILVLQILEIISIKMELLTSLMSLRFLMRFITVKWML